MTNVVGCQFGLDPKPLHTLHVRDMKVHTIASFKLKWSTSLVWNSSLVRTWQPSGWSRCSGPFLGLSDKVRDKDHSLAKLNSIQRCATSVPIECFKWCHHEALVIIIIVRELSQ
jgi:hypothetical protein